MGCRRDRCRRISANLCVVPASLPASARQMFARICAGRGECPSPVSARCCLRVSCRVARRISARCLGSAARGLRCRLSSEDTSGTSGALGSVRANGAADGLRVCPAVYARELRQPGESSDNLHFGSGGGCLDGGVSQRPRRCGTAMRGDLVTSAGGDGPWI